MIRDKLDEDDEEEGPAMMIRVSTKNSKKPKKLSRPIIVISNDIYGRDITPLLKHAIGIKVRGVDSHKLQDRLEHICLRENLSID
jgi:hypothetical protein